MRGIIFYRKDSESQSAAEQYEHDFERFTGKKLDMMDVDTREGTALARIHDIVQYPAIVALDNEGKLQNAWQGDPLPTMDNVAGYLRQ